MYLHCSRSYINTVLNIHYIWTLIILSMDFDGQYIGLVTMFPSASLFDFVWHCFQKWFIDHKKWILLDTQTYIIHDKQYNLLHIFLCEYCITELQYKLNKWMS